MGKEDFLHGDHLVMLSQVPMSCFLYSLFNACETGHNWTPFPKSPSRFLMESNFLTAAMATIVEDISSLDIDSLFINVLNRFFFPQRRRQEFSKQIS